jgi:hypothetical protein
VKYLLELIYELIIVLKGVGEKENQDHNQKIKNESNIKNQNQQNSIIFEEESPISKSYPDIEINNINKSDITDDKLFNLFDISYNQQPKKDNRNSKSKISDQTTNINERSSTPTKSKISRNDYFNNTINLQKNSYIEKTQKKRSVSDNNMSFSNENSHISKIGPVEKSEISMTTNKSNFKNSKNLNKTQNLSFELNFDILNICGELPLSEFNLKCEIKKRLIEICNIHPFKKFKDLKSIDKLIYSVLNSFKDVKRKYDKLNFQNSQQSQQFQFENTVDNKSVCITKEFLLTHEKDLQKIIIYYLIKRDEQISYINKIAKNIVNDPNVVNRINNYILRKNEIKVKKIKERYSILKEKYKDELKFCNDV